MEEKSKDEDVASVGQENIYENIQPTIEIEETKKVAEVEKNCLLTDDHVPSLIDCSFSNNDAPVTGMNLVLHFDARLKKIY